MYPSIRWSVNAAPWVSTPCWESTVSLHQLPTYLFFLTAGRESLPWLPRHVTQSTFPSWLGLSVHAQCTQCMVISSCPACPLLLSEVSWYFIAEWPQLSSLERNAKLFLPHLHHMIWNSYPGDLQERVNSGLQWEHWWRALALSAAEKASSCYLHAGIHLQTRANMHRKSGLCGARRLERQSMEGTLSCWSAQASMRTHWQIRECNLYELMV